MARAILIVAFILASTFSYSAGKSIKFEPEFHSGRVVDGAKPGLGDNLYDFCNTSLTPLVIHSFVIKPDEIIKGKSVSLTATATLSKNITGGKIEGKIVVDDIIPVTLNYDLCEELKSTDFKCPLVPKDYTVSQSIDIPEIIPKGNAKGSVKVTDQDGTEIACINVHAKIQ